MKIRVLFLSLLIPAIAVATTLKVEQDTDPITNTQILATKPWVLHHAHLVSGGSAYMALVLKKTQRPEAGPEYLIEVYCGPSKGHPLNVPAGNSLLTVVDGRAVSYYSEGTAASLAAPGARDSIRPHSVYEDIPTPDWKAMAQAKTIHLKVAGPAESVTADLDDHELQTLRQFVSQFVHSSDGSSVD